VLEGIAAGEDRGVGGAGLGNLDDGVLEEDAFPGQPVQDRCLRAGVAVGADAVRPQGVDSDEKDIGPGGDAEARQDPGAWNDYRRRPESHGPGFAPGAVGAYYVRSSVTRS
jgi:hypothetical protein